MRIFVVASALSIVLSACAAPSMSPMAVGEIPGPTWTSKTVVYQCQPDTKLQVAYLTMKSGESFAALHYKGNTVLLQSRLMGSGVRYVALDEQNSLRWTTKGNSGFLTFMAANHTAQEQTLLSDCNAISAG